MRRSVLIFLLHILPLAGYACTTAIVRAEASASGRPLLWKQRDTERKGNYIKHFKGEKYAFTGLVDEGKEAEVWDGANEAGFIIANNLSYNLRPDSLKGKKMTAGIIMKAALGKCATVDEFEAMIVSMPQPRRVSANFAVVDAAGGAAYFEVWDYGYTRFDVPEEGISFRTNYSYSGKPKEGRGYGRHDMVSNRIALHGPTGYSPEWFFSLGREIPIARPTTTSCLVFEGGESVTIWAATGYTPCAYPLPIWVEAGDLLPECLAKGSGMFATADSLRTNCSPALLQRSIVPSMEKAEKREMREGRSLQRSFLRKGMDREALKEYYRKADKRFKKAYLR